MFGLDLFGIKRRRQAREAEAEAQRKRLVDRTAPISRAQHQAIAAPRDSSRSSSPAYSSMHDPLNPLNPLSPLSPVNQVESY